MSADRPVVESYVYVATFADGSQIKVEEIIDSNGERVDHAAATRPDRFATWGPPVDLIDAEEARLARLDACTCGEIGHTGSHRPGCPWAMRARRTEGTPS